MRCPACGRDLTRMSAGGLDVDVCSGGCGGMWFDAQELPKLEYANQSAGEPLLEVSRDPSVVVDVSAGRNCPKDLDVEMMRHFESAEQKVSVDECPECGGTWLDAGELATIRSEYGTEEERQKAADAYFSELFDKKLSAQLEKDQAFAEKAHRIAWHFRFICPSYYIPGKQRWGAF